MTVWRKGMLAAVVLGGWRYEDGGAVPNPPEIGDVFKVRGVSVLPPQTLGLWKKLFGKRQLHLNIASYGWVRANIFRPIVSDDDNAEIIAQIKACKPARIPHLEPLRGYPSNDQPSGAHSHALAGSRADDPTRRPCNLAHGQASKDGGEQGSYRGSVFHGEGN